MSNPHRAAPRGVVALIALGLALGLAGCRFVGGTRPAFAPGVEVTSAAEGDTAARAAPRTIPLELVFVRCDEHDAALSDELWQFVDEQGFDADLRRRLAANGLRVGIVGGHLPPHLAARFTAAAEAGPETLATDAAVSRRTLRLLPGRRGEVVMASGIRELVLLEHADGGVRGGTYADASPVVSLRAKPAADGRVSIEAVPEIRHGPVEKSWVGEDGMFRLETGQRRHQLEHLAITAVLPREGMLVLACGGDDTASVGDCLLRDHDRGERTSVRLLAIRPLADTIDPLFAPPDDEVVVAADEPPLVVR
ncbi:MAG: hypothetical protein ACKO1M_10450 [Planctomycetota bacterium]